MDCPNCGIKMKHIRKTEMYFTTFCEFNDYNDDYYYNVDIYRCKACKIKYSNKENKEKWEIPEEFLLTEKQIKTIKMIDRWLGTNGVETIQTKRQGIKFINDNLNACLLKKEQNTECYDGTYEWFE